MWLVWGSDSNKLRWVWFLTKEGKFNIECKNANQLKCGQFESLQNFVFWAIIVVYSEAKKNDTNPRVLSSIEGNDQNYVNNDEDAFAERRY